MTILLSYNNVLNYVDQIKTWTKNNPIL